MTFYLTLCFVTCQKLDEYDSIILILGQFSHPNIVRYVTCWTDCVRRERNPLITEVDESLSDSPVFPTAAIQSDLGPRAIEFSTGDGDSPLWVGSDDSDWSSDYDDDDDESDPSEEEGKEIVLYAGQEVVVDDGNMSLSRRERRTSSFSEEYFLLIQMDFCAYSLRFYMNIRNNIKDAAALDEICRADTLSFQANISTFKSKSVGEFVSEGFKIATNVLDGLNYLHEQHVMHRDIKPENILYSDTSKMWQICDFGLAREIHENQFTDKKHVITSIKACLPSSHVKYSLRYSESRIHFPPTLHFRES